MKARGFVLNRDTGEPVSGVNVVARAKRNGTTTSLGLLTTDEAGYVSFDLSGVVDSTVLEGVSLEVVGQPDAAATVVSEEFNGERPASPPSPDGAVVLRVDPARVQTVATPARPAVQKPDARDWELSPASFVTPRTVALGEGACRTPVRSDLPAHQIRFVQIMRRPTQLAPPATSPQPAPAGGDSQMTVEGLPGRLDVSNPVLDPISPAGDVMFGVLRCDILEYEQTWQDVGECLGTILYSLPLAPCESVKIAVIEAERSDEAARSDAIDARENLTHSLFRDRNIAETVKGVLRESQSGSSFMAGQGAAYSGSWENVGTFGVTHAIGYASSQSRGMRDLDTNSAQDLHDSTVQNTGYVRSLNSTVIVQGAQAERHQLETRTITNHNHCHALTVQYYEVLRRLKLETRLVGSRPGVLIPYLGLRFKSPRPTIEKRHVEDTPFGHEEEVLVDPNRDDLHLVNRLRPMLESSLLEPRLVANFEAVRRLLFFERTTPPEVQSPPSWEYLVKEIKVTLFRGKWGNDPDSISMRLRAGSSYAKYEKPYRPYRDHENYNDWVILESNDIGGDHEEYEDSPRKLGVLGPWKFTLATPILRSVLTEFEIHFDRGGDFSLKGLKATATKPDGIEEEVLVDEDSNTVFNREGAFERFTIRRPTVAPTTDPKNGNKDRASSNAERRVQDVGLAWELITHLYDHRDTYGPRLVAMKEPMWFAEALDWAMGRGAARDNIDSVPVAISGQHIVFAYHGADASITTPLPATKQPTATIVSLPTRGVLAEAQLGNCNACEKRDVTRFWKWEESPCEQAPAIEGITPGFRGQPTTVGQGQLPNAVVQITQPPAAPDPVGLAAAMTLLGKGDAFRDMSGLPELQQLLSGLASGAVDLVKAKQLAQQVQAKQATQGGGGSSGGGGGQPRTPEQRYDNLQVIKAARDDGLLTDGDARAAALDQMGVGGSGDAGTGGSGQAGTRQGADWENGPITCRKGSSTSLPLAAYLQLIREVETAYTSGGETTKEIVQRLRRLYYGQHVKTCNKDTRVKSSSAVGHFFDVLIANVTSDYLAPPLTTPPLSESSLDRLYEADSVLAKGYQVDPSHLFVAADIALAGPSVPPGGKELEARFGLDLRGLVTWVGDLASWFLEWNTQRAKAENSGITRTPESNLTELKKICTSKVDLDDLLGDMDGQIIAWRLTDLAAGTNPLPAISDLIESYYADAVIQPHVTRRFELFLKHSAPRIPYAEGPATMKLHPGAPKFVKDELVKVIRAFLQTIRNTSVPPSEITKYANIISYIADDFCEFLRRGLAGEVVWPRR